MTALRGLTREEIARELDRLRPWVIGTKQRDFPSIPTQELENAYGDICLAALERDFATPDDVAAWAHAALRHDALDIVKSMRFRTTTELREQAVPAGVAARDPEDGLISREAHEVLLEFLALLSPADRRIAYLRLDPEHDWEPREIAAALDLPSREVRKTLQRIGVRLRRFAALAVRPGALCEQRRPDALRWQQTGQMPLPLKFHLRRCSACQLEHRHARETLRGVLLPLLPAGSLPIATGGAFAHLAHILGAHPLAQRASDTATRLRKVAPAGGGSAIAAKVIITTAVVATSTVGALQAVTSPSHPAPRRHLVHARVARQPIRVPAQSELPPTQSPQGRDDATTRSPDR